MTIVVPHARELASERTKPSRLGLAVMLTGAFVTVLDAFIVFVAMPAIRVQLGTSFGEAGLVVAGYNLTFAAGLITSGRLGDIYGHRRLFLVALACFTLTSGLCGLATSATTLILARLAQGLSASLLMPQIYSIIRLSYENPAERRQAFAWMGGVLGAASVLGQLLGGLLLAANFFSLGWRSVFLLNIPVGLAALLAGRAVPQTARPPKQRLDLLGAALSAVSLAALLYPLAEGPEIGWPVWLVAMLPMSVLATAIFLVVQRSKSLNGDFPLLHTALLSDREFRKGAAMVLLFYAAGSPFMLTFSYFFQLGVGHTPIEAALDFSPLAIALSIASILAGRRRKGDEGTLLLAGAIACWLSYAVIAICIWIEPAASATLLLVPMAVLGAGQGLIMTPIVNVVLSRLEDAHTGSAAGVLAMMQRTGSALGIAVLGAAFGAVLEMGVLHRFPPVTAYANAFAVVTGLSSLLMAAVAIMMVSLREKPSSPCSKALLDA